MKIRSHKELRVWRDAMDAAMEIFHHSKTFPDSERFSLTDQIRLLALGGREHLGSLAQRSLRPKTNRPDQFDMKHEETE